MSHRPVVLVAHGDPAVRAVLGDCLREEGYRVAEAADAEAALARLAGRRVALVLAHPGLPGGPAGDRWAALDRLREAAGATPTAILTAAHPATFADHAARGYAALIPAPFDLDELCATVRRVLAARHAGPAPGAG
jgi:CheY-like chemotaxis protein